MDFYEREKAMVRMPHWPISYGHKIVDLKLERIQKLLGKLGDPHLNMPPLVHVAGTNGKGSTIAYLKGIFEAAGYKVHRYTSPHLVHFNERIMICGQEISDSMLYKLAEECRLAAGDLGLTFFEGTTAIAFLAFARFKADIVLLETGVGGRLDATNVVQDPLLTIITPISLDHVEYLGATIPEIAYEKAGIIKLGRQCVISWQPKEAFEVLKEVCAARQALYFAYHEHWNFQKTAGGFAFMQQDQVREFPVPALKGVHQVMNASAAVAAAYLLKKDYELLTDRHIELGLLSAKWPARLQKLEGGILSSMLPSSAELWVDGAHNIAGAEMLVLSLSQMIEPEKLLYVINGCTKQRDIVGFLHPFLGKVEMICAVTVQSEPLSKKASNIEEVATSMGFVAVACNDLKDAVKRCITEAAGRPACIIICGSLYLAADVLLVNQES